MRPTNREQGSNPQRSYIASYIFIFGSGFILMRRLVRFGIEPVTEKPRREETARLVRPVSAATEELEANPAKMEGGNVS